ncbi:adenylate/guanylate cyclase domain-containing protein [Agrobacterium rosae]|uniref:adenylate/guanylate cyclase domain-containing protein n=1 Tax=Agrobacterium rosae TaxID=1972867 RepID=UPI000CD9DEFB|nr:adenylate/guanylate cyclase domain-containing protein [Agrobacterium rosae]POO57213.1 adenylate/guanylate cyclase domain-containing protein [Agrobacterium rosae]
MTIADEIKSNANATFSTKWTVRDGRSVPGPEDLKHSNDAVYFQRATILYADLDGSTNLVEKKKWEFSGQVYKTFLYTTSRLIRNMGGSIVSYDGDRVMGIFISDTQANDAVSCALRMNFAVKNYLQPVLDKNWSGGFKIRHIVGVDTSPIRAARTGVRGDNDIVWIGNAANLAAKLTALSADQPTYITKRVYDRLSDHQKLGPQKEDIWKKWQWSQHGNEEILSTNYWQNFL